MRTPPERTSKPITDMHQLSLYLNKLVRQDTTLGFTVEHEYPGHAGGKKSARCWEEKLTIEIEADDSDEIDGSEDTDDFDSLTLKITDFGEGEFSYELSVSAALATGSHSGTSLKEAANLVYQAIWAPVAKISGKPALAQAQEKPSIQLVQHISRNGPQTTWTSWLDITSYNMHNDLDRFQVPCVTVDYATHIADVDHFLATIGFDLNAFSGNSNTRTYAAVQKELARCLGDKAVVQTTGKLQDANGPLYLVFILNLPDTAQLHGMIHLRPDEEPDDEEEFDN